MPAELINVRRPDGTLISATPEEAARLQVLGYTPETPEEQVARTQAEEEERYYSTGTQKLATAAEGALSGATVGLSDFVVDGKNTQKRAEYNPGTRVGFQIAGAIAPALISGGAYTPAGALSRGAGRLAEGVAEGQIARTAIAAGVESGVQSIGAEAGRAHLAGDPITTESLLAAGGFGTVFGMGLGGTIGVLGRGAQRLAGKVAEEKAAAAVDSLLDDTLGEGVSPSSLFSREHFQPLRSAVEDLRGAANRVVDDADLAAGAAQRAASKEARAAHKMAKEAGLVPEPVPAGAAPEPTGPRYDPEELATAQKIGKNELRALKNSGDEFLGTLTLGGQGATKEGIAATKAIRSAYRRATEAAESGDPLKLRKALDDYRAALTQHSDALSPKQGIPKPFEGVVPKALPEPTVTPKEPHVSPALGSWIDEANAANVAASSKALKDVSELRAAARELKNFPVYTENFLSMSAARAERQFAAMDAVLKAGGPEMDGLKTAVAQAADRITAVTGVAAEGTPVDRLRAAWSALRKASTQKAIKDTRAAVAAAKPGEHEHGLLGKIIKQASSRWASTTSRKMGAGAFLSSSAYQTAGAIAGAAMGGPAGAGILAEVTGVRALVQKALRDGVAKYGPRAARGAARVAPQASPLSIRLDGTKDDKPGTQAELFHRRSEEIRQAGVTGADTLFRAVTPLHAAGHSEFAQQLHKSAVGMLRSLHEVLPRDPGDSYSNGKSMWDPDEVELLGFERYYEAFHDLLGTASRALEGDVTVEGAEALRRFAPALFQEVQSGLLERVLTDQEFADSLDYEDQADLSILCDLELHSTFRTDWLVEQQTMFAERDVPPQGSGRTAGPMGPGRPPGPASSGGGMATPAQMITER